VLPRGAPGAMKLTIFGLTISSSWGNGHATLWRGLIGALIRRGHRVAFFERDVPYYAATRDLHEIAGGALHLYRSWPEACPQAEREVRDSDAAIVTSYCPDGAAAAELLAGSAVPRRIFYDMDTPVTLALVEAGETPPWLGGSGLADYDLVLSFTGGSALDRLRHRLGAVRVAPLYGSVDPDVHRRTECAEQYRADLSYLGTYAQDRQETLQELLIEPARRLPARRFLIGGAQYPAEFPWTPNIFFVRHLPPVEHPAFFSSSAMTLNVTRRTMAEMGWCPSGRLFEAAACGAPILSDWWEGLDSFFEPGEEILVARSAEDVVGALSLAEGELHRVAARARERVLAEHTAERRAQELEALVADTPLAPRAPGRVANGAVMEA
jgi:spore maturation protein CgeB